MTLVCTSTCNGAARMTRILTTKLTKTGITISSIGYRRASPAALLGVLTRYSKIVLNSPALNNRTPIRVRATLNLILRRLPGAGPINIFNSCN